VSDSVSHHCYKTLRHKYQVHFLRGKGLEGCSPTTEQGYKLTNTAHHDILETE